MELLNDLSSNLDAEANKSIGTATAIARRPLTFYDGEKHAFVPIEPEIIDKLRLTRHDLFTQEVQGENIVLRRFKETT